MIIRIIIAVIMIVIKNDNENKDSKSNNSNTSKNDIYKSFSNNNSDKSYVWSYYILLIQAF